MARAGRPKKYNKAEEMQNRINEYFINCDKKREPYTITGLAIALDLDRRSLVNYSKENEFFPTIKKAKAKVEECLEKRLLLGNSSTGVIFNLKNNFDWEDKQEVKHSGKLKLEDVL